MNAPEKRTRESRHLPRPVQVIAGLVLAAITLLCVPGSLLMLFGPNEKAPVLAHVLGVVWTCGCGWVLGASERLMTGRKTSGGLFAPTTLRIIAWLFLLIPIGAVLMGHIAMATVMGVAKLAFYLILFIGFHRLAAVRERNALVQRE